MTDDFQMKFLFFNTYLIFSLKVRLEYLTTPMKCHMAIVYYLTAKI